MNPTILWIAALLSAATAIGLLLSRDWRWSLGLFAIQYFAAFGLIFDHWPLTMSAAKLIAGWMAAAVLGMTYINLKDRPTAETSWPEGRLFRIFASGLVLIVVSAVTTQVVEWLPDAGLPIIWGALMLIGLGFLHLGMTLHPLRVILGLLTTLLGFEMLYSTIENSILVTGLLSGVTLGLALVGSYLLILNNQDGDE
ncbi:MAG: hypothetical protein NT121_25270 [Chloroflexi bacterium]|nr:hypothetical protein [Chloroflexota bacterium]